MDQPGQFPERQNFSRKDHTAYPRGNSNPHQFKENTNTTNPHRVKKQRQRTTAIALGVLMLVSLGLIGFEVISKHTPSVDNQTIRGSQSLLILSQEKAREGAGLIANLTSNWDNHNGNNVDALKDSNRLQTNKIKALKRQLVDANQKLHEVKSHLFTKGDPSDRARLAEICQELVEKDQKNFELQDKIQKLEKESDFSSQKVNRMEHTIDALATMTDTQRSTKEQAIFHFQAQIEQLQNNAREEKQELERSIEEFEEAQFELKEAFADKLAMIKNLEDEISWQYTLLEDKDKEIKSQSQLYTTSESHINHQLQDLIATLELEILKNENLQSELDVSHARQSAQQQYSKSIEERLVLSEEKAQNHHNVLANHSIALAKEYLDLQGLLDVYTHSHDHFANKQRKLIAMVKEEKSQADKLQNELNTIMTKNDAEQQRGFCLEEELYTTAQQVASLQEDLKAQHAILDSKQQELETLTYSNASLRDQLHEKINQLTASLGEEQKSVLEQGNTIRDLTINIELEKTRSQELDFHLKQELTAHTTESERSHSLDDKISQKAETIVALEDRLQDKQHEINELKNQINVITDNFEQEKMRTNELHQALVTSLDENETEQFKIKGLKDTLDENTDTLTLLQDRMSSKKSTISEIQTRLDELTIELEQEKKKNKNIEHSLTSTVANRDLEQQRATSLETDVRSNSERIVSLQDSVADKQQEVRNLLAKVQQVTNGLEKEKSHSQDLQRELETAHTRNDHEVNHVSSLEETVEENERQIRALLDQLDQMSADFDLEHSRTKELENNLFSSLSQHETQIQRTEHLEQNLLDNDNEINFFQYTIKEQQMEIEQLKGNLNNLSNHVELEKNRSLAFQKASDTELQRISELEQQLQYTTRNADDLKEGTTVKDQEIKELEYRVSQLSYELDQEYTKSEEISSQLESEFVEGHNLRTYTQNLEQQVDGLHDEISEKERALSQIVERDRETQFDYNQLQVELRSLQAERDLLERKYSEQLNLLLEQQELVNTLSNDLSAQKEAMNQIERSRQEIAYELENTNKENTPFIRELTKRMNHSTTSKEVSSTTITHVVAEGDTLSSISMQYYGTPNRWIDVYNANRKMIPNKNSLNDGIKLIIPK